MHIKYLEQCLDKQIIIIYFLKKLQNPHIPLKLKICIIPQKLKNHIFVKTAKTYFLVTAPTHIRYSQSFYSCLATIYPTHVGITRNLTHQAKKDYKRRKWMRGKGIRDWENRRNGGKLKYMVYIECQVSLAGCDILEFWWKKFRKLSQNFSFLYEQEKTQKKIT